MNSVPNKGFIEIETREALKSHIERENGLARVAVQGLELLDPEIEGLLRSVSALGSYFLGCTLSRGVEAHVRQTGGMVFPDFSGMPFNAYRSSLYTVKELMEGYERGRRETLAHTLDGKIHAYFQKHRVGYRPTPIIPALAFRIHDHAIDNALYALLYPAQASPLAVVAVMGGHKMRRDDPHYRQVATLSGHLTRKGYFVASGGGPGAMEATNLGAYLSGHHEQDLDWAIRTLAEQPVLTDALYLEKAYDVLDRFPSGSPSLAVPTWFYGNEPTNLFAAHVAKYFANSIREDGILSIARHGVVFAPGSAGTIQEIFMDAAQNRYWSYGVISPMVFVGTKFWTETKPVYPLLRSLAAGCAYQELILLSDDIGEILRFFDEHRPVSFEPGIETPQWVDRDS